MKQVDILSFNTVEVANTGDDFELLHKGKPTGITLHVLGKHSDTVKNYNKEQLKDYSRKQSLAEKKGTQIEFQAALIERMDERTIDSALVRVTGWTGAGDFDKEKLRIALGNNPEWIDEIIEFSDSLGK